MIIQVDDWQFDVDVDYTRKYNQTIAQCQCSYDRNYYAAVDKLFPEVRSFLAQFGVDVTHPEEIFSVDQDDEPINYMSWYTVKGKILQLGGYEIDIGPVHILPQHRNEVMLPNPDCDKDDPESYFVLSFLDINLPWVLDEPMPKAQPARKAHNWVDKFLDKILKRK